jgi:hypothetical protein
VPILGGNGQFVPILGGLTKKEAVCKTWGFSKEDPPPSKYFDLCFCFSGNGFGFLELF